MISRIVLGLAVACAGAAAQTSTLVFDVTSVKPVIPAPGRGVPPNCQSGRFSTVAELYRIVNWAFELKPYELAGLFYEVPAWARGNLYEIQASASGSGTETECRQMVKALLAERFKFAAHWDITQGRVLHLVVNRSGSRMQQVTESDTGQGFKITQDGRRTQQAIGSPIVRGLTMNEFAEWIGLRIPNAPVLDNTGLAGTYKITLSFSSGSHRNEFPDPFLPQAIEEQLGLRLEEHDGSVRKLIVDHIEMPDPN